MSLNKKISVLIIFLLSASLFSNSCLSQSFQKRYQSQDLLPIFSRVIADNDSGHIIQSYAARGNIQNSTTDEITMRYTFLDKSGNVVNSYDYYSQDTAYRMAAGDYGKSILKNTTDGFVAENALGNHSITPVYTSCVIYKLDANANVVWSYRIDSVRGWSNKKLASIDGSFYVGQEKFLDTFYNGNRSYLRADYLLYKFSGNGAYVFGKQYISPIGVEWRFDLFSNKKKQLILLGETTNSHSSSVSVNIQFGNLLLIDTNGNVISSKRYDSFRPFNIIETHNGNYFMQGTKNGFHENTVFGLFDSLFNPIWMKILPEGYSWYSTGAVEQPNGNFLLNLPYTHFDNWNRIVEIDNAGNFLNAHSYHHKATLYTEFIKDNFGRYLWTGVDTANRLLVFSTHNIGMINGCEALELCGIQFQNFTTPVSNITWQVKNINNVQPFPLLRKQVPVQAADYCLPFGALNAHFNLQDTVCTGRLITLLSDSSVTEGVSVWIINDSATGYYVQKSLSYSFTTPGNYIIKHYHTRVGCIDSFERSLVVLPFSNGNVSYINFCDTANAAPVLLRATGRAATYEWSNGGFDSTTTITSQGLYWCRYYLGCGVVTDSFYVRSQQNIQFYLPNDTQICAHNFPFIIKANTGFGSYWWNEVAGTETYVARDSGLYICEAQNLCGTVKDSIHIAIARAPVRKNTTLNFVVNEGEEITLNACAIADVYNWGTNSNSSPPDSILRFIATESSTVYLTVTSNEGCKDVCVYNIAVKNNDVLLLPTAFSPNGDGLNDEFRILNTNIKLLAFNIYNRWGEMVFSSNNQRNGWDGTFKNEAQDIGVYTWSVEYIVMGSGKQKMAKGNVTLVR
jgi:gliding motility-associated-like protein